MRIKKVGKKYRIVHADTGLTLKTVNGAPVDGGGHYLLAQAQRQLKHINERNKDRKG